MSFVSAESREAAAQTSQQNCCSYVTRSRQQAFLVQFCWDGSFISGKTEPGDFDILLIGPADLQVRNDTEPNLASLLDTGAAEAQGYSLFFVTKNSPMRELISTVWDFSKEGIAKGIVELAL